MLSPEQDFHFVIDRAANSITDATCSVRALGRGRLPHPHRRLIASALRKLEGAQQDLFTARSDPWTQPPKPKQLELL